MSEEDFNYYQESLFNAIENECSFRLEIQLLSQQNTDRYFMGIGHPYYDEMGEYCGIVGLFLDVNDARLTEINLLNSRRKYQLLFDSLISGFIYFRGIYDEHNNRVLLPCWLQILIRKKELKSNSSMPWNDRRLRIALKVNFLLI
jgi:hypothetical protein